MEFKLPDVGEGIHEGEILRWHVQEGESVEENQTLVEIETDKAVVEIPSPCAGVVASLPHEPGDVVDVGETLIVIDEGKEAGTVVGNLPDEDDEAPDDVPGGDGQNGPVPAAPATRKLARELGVDLNEVEGTGPDGRVMPDDVRRRAEGEDEGDHVRRVPVRGVRRSVAETMAASQREMPQATHTDAADVTELRAALERRSETLTWTVLLVRAAAAVLPDHPRVNARFDADAEQIVEPKHVHMGVSVDTEDGLIVPVVRRAEEKDLDELAADISRLVAGARDRSLDLEELRGATFTVTNIGAIGGRWGVARVPPEQGCVLVAGRAAREPAVHDGEVVPRVQLPLSVSFDHRLLDGADVARFTSDLIDELEDDRLLNGT